MTEPKPISAERGRILRAAKAIATTVVSSFRFCIGGERRPARRERVAASLTNCPIREHTGDGAYVGRCDFAAYDDVCPRHGRISMYPTRDDREVHPRDRDFSAADNPWQGGKEPS